MSPGKAWAQLVVISLPNKSRMRAAITPLNVLARLPVSILPNEVSARCWIIRDAPALLFIAPATSV